MNHYSKGKCDCGEEEYQPKFDKKSGWYYCGKCKKEILDDEFDNEVYYTSSKKPRVRKFKDSRSQ